MDKRTARVVVGANRAIRRGMSWGVKGASFYAGYRVLHHEIFEVETAEPLLVVLGLWLCGIAPASFIDSLRQLGAKAEETVQQATDELESAAKLPDSPPDANGA